MGIKRLQVKSGLYFMKGKQPYRNRDKWNYKKSPGSDFGQQLILLEREAECKTAELQGLSVIPGMYCVHES